MNIPAKHMQMQARPPVRHTEWYNAAMEQLLTVVQKLSHARDLETVMAIVRVAARNLTGADGATFVLRDGDQCFYAEENAVSPLWKGRRFPLETCISGWTMLNAKAAVIEDIYVDPRIPADAYRPTFVKSLAMVPIRRELPIGAIGNYWATQRMPTDEELEILQALADTTSVALENASLYKQLEEKIRALEDSNYELSRFAWVASHDLQEPLRTITTQVEMLDRRYGPMLEPSAREYIQLAASGATRLQNLIDDMLVHARAEKADDFTEVNLQDTLNEVLDGLQTMIEEHHAKITCGDLPVVRGNPVMLARVLRNLIINAVKFHRPDTVPEVRIGCTREGGMWKCVVSDNGIGIPVEYHQQIFGFFQRLHSQAKYPGSGIGLATCKKIVGLHGGTIGVESTPGKGSIFYFTLPAIS